MGVYKSFYDFVSRYYGIDKLLAGSQVNPAAYKALYPIHVFDVSNQIDFFLIFLFMHFYPGTMTTHAESINSDLQRGLDRRLRHTQH